MLSSQTKDQITHAAMISLRDHTLTVDNILNTPDDVLGKLIYPCAFWKVRVFFVESFKQITTYSLNAKGSFKIKLT